jgi:hypothetical protein
VPSRASLASGPADRPPTERDIPPPPPPRGVTGAQSGGAGGGVVTLGGPADPPAAPYVAAVETQTDAAKALGSEEVVVMRLVREELKLLERKRVELLQQHATAGTQQQQHASAAKHHANAEQAQQQHASAAQQSEESGATQPAGQAQQHESVAQQHSNAEQPQRGVEEVEEVEQNVSVQEGARKQQGRRVKEEWVWDSSSLSMLAWTCAIGATGAAASLSHSLTYSLCLSHLLSVSLAQQLQHAPPLHDCRFD